MATLSLKQHTLICEGEWNLKNLFTLEKLFAKLSPPSGKLIIDGRGITHLDTGAAWLLIRWTKQSHAAAQFENFSTHAQQLIDLLQQRSFDATDVPSEPTDSFLSRLGKSAIRRLSGFYAFLNFIGQLFLESTRLFFQPLRIRWRAIFSTIDKTGYQALPIIGLLSFMIGVVLTYQMGVQLRNYGANIFIVDLLGLAVLREFGPLLTAIMVAGRTGSAYTAQLGSMKVNQEIDALNTMGVTPGELLLLPRIIGLTLALPLLTMWADIFGVIGGIVMSGNMLNIHLYDFLQRFQNQIPLKALLLGLVKTPVFAMLIASIGCFQGMHVKNNADSIGANTTKSVVYAIFFIIVADAAFSIIFSKLHL